MALPFKCPYCKGYLCPEHRIPEKHACPEGWKARAPRNVSPIIVDREVRRPTIQPRRPYTSKYSATGFWFSAPELKHFSLATLLVMGVGVSFNLYAWGESVFFLASLAIAFTISFFLHEIAHKFSAQHLGLWAEFRLTMQGILITLFSMFLPFKIISPGAVMLGGRVTKETAGKIGLAGPLTNLMISLTCALVAVTSRSPFLWTVAGINAMIALYNLIPFGVMDGLKIFMWSKAVWMTTFLGSFVLTIITYGLTVGSF